MIVMICVTIKKITLSELYDCVWEGSNYFKNFCPNEFKQINDWFVDFYCGY